MKLKYTGNDYRDAIDMALVNNCRNLEIYFPKPLSNWALDETYHAAEKYIRFLASKYDFNVHLEIKISGSKLERILKAV